MREPHGRRDAGRHIGRGSGRQYGGHERAERRLSGVQELLRGGAEGQGRHRVRGSRGDSRF